MANCQRNTLLALGRVCHPGVWVMGPIPKASSLGELPEEGALWLDQTLQMGEAEKAEDWESSLHLQEKNSGARFSFLPPPHFFFFLSLILPLSGSLTMATTMILSKWFHRLLFRHSTFNISILSFCCYTKGALLQYNVLRIMSMSNNGF